MFDLRLSLHGDRDFIARAAEIGQAHRDNRSRRNAARHSDVHLVIAWITRRRSEIQDFGKASADGDLGRDGSPLGKAAHIHRQNLASHCRGLRRSPLSRYRVPDGALPSSISGKENSVGGDDTDAGW